MTLGNMMSAKMTTKQLRIILLEHHSYRRGRGSIRGSGTRTWSVSRHRHIPAATCVNKAIAAMTQRGNEIYLSDLTEADESNFRLFCDSAKGIRYNDLQGLLARVRQRVIDLLRRENLALPYPRPVEKYMKVYDGMCEGVTDVELSQQLRMTKQRVGQIRAKIKSLSPVQELYRELTA